MSVNNTLTFANKDILISIITNCIYFRIPTIENESKYRVILYTKPISTRHQLFYEDFNTKDEAENRVNCINNSITCK